jgi:RNA polymerase subunit RPABC4/transcription elongation factor Spt4
MKFGNGQTVLSDGMCPQCGSYFLGAQEEAEIDVDVNDQNQILAPEQVAPMACGVAVATATYAQPGTVGVPASSVPVYTGQPVHGQAVSAQAVPAQAVPAQAVPAQAVPAQAVPAQAVPGSSAPDSTMFGFSHQPVVQAAPALAVPAQPMQTRACPKCTLISYGTGNFCNMCGGTL